MGQFRFGHRMAKNWLHISARYRMFQGLKTQTMFYSRDPIERFISGYVDKCMTERVYRKQLGTCNNCEDNVTCFVEQEYIRMQRFVRGDRVNSL